MATTRLVPGVGWVTETDEETRLLPGFSFITETEATAPPPTTANPWYYFLQETVVA